MIARAHARAKVRELELHFSTRHFSLLLFPAQLSWPDGVDNWRTWISAKRDSLMNALSLLIGNNYIFESFQRVFFDRSVKKWEKRKVND